VAWLRRRARDGAAPRACRGRKSQFGTEIRVSAPYRLGGLLHDHVRVEERELFEEIERIVPAAELEGVRL
jgi:hypothetical protein